MVARRGESKAGHDEPDESGDLTIGRIGPAEVTSSANQDSSASTAGTIPNQSGHATLHRLRAIAQAHETEIIGDLTADETSTLTALIGRLNATAGLTGEGHPGMNEQRSQRSRAPT